MLDHDHTAANEGSGTMLFRLLKSILMILPQSTCYRVLRDRLISVSRFRQCTILGSVTTKLVQNDNNASISESVITANTKSFVSRTNYIRSIHCTATWDTIRQDSLEMRKAVSEQVDDDEGADRRSWLGYESKEEQVQTEQRYQNDKRQVIRIEDISPGYHDIDSVSNPPVVKEYVVPDENNDHVSNNKPSKETGEENHWKQFWASAENN